MFLETIFVLVLMYKRDRQEKARVGVRAPQNGGNVSRCPAPVAVSKLKKFAKR